LKCASINRGEVLQTGVAAAITGFVYSRLVAEVRTPSVGCSVERQRQCVGNARVRCVFGCARVFIPSRSFAACRPSFVHDNPRMQLRLFAFFFLFSLFFVFIFLSQQTSHACVPFYSKCSHAGVYCWRVACGRCKARV